MADYATSISCQRRAIRRWVRICGEVVRARDFALVARHLIDLSEDGLRAVADAAVGEGERIFVAFRLPGTRLWIEREGEVAHVGSDGSIGIAFDAAARNDRALLAGQLRRLPPVVPRRESGTFRASAAE